MGTILGRQGYQRVSYGAGHGNALLRGVAREDPMRLDNGDAELERLLVLDTGCGGEPTRDRGAARRCCRRCAHEMRRVDLDLVAPLRAHFLQRHLRVLKQHGILHVPEAYADSGRVCHGVRAHAEQIRREDACGGAQDELEGVFCVDLETRKLR